MLSLSLPRTLGVGTLLVGGLLAASPACSGSPSFDGSDTGGSTGGPCPIAGVTGCGESCTSDNQCGTGLFCDTDSKKCDAECVAGTTSSPECDGAPCAANGRCLGGDPGTGGVTGAGGGGIDPGPTGGGGGEGGGTSCIDVEVTPTPIIPNVALLIDRSLSMTDIDGYAALVQDAIVMGDYVPMDDCTGPVVGNPGGGGDAELWRWNVVRTALFNPTDGIVTSLEGSIRFGLTTYSRAIGTGATCPELTNVDLAFDNRDAMLAGMACSDLLGYTPTRDSLAPTADALAALAVDGPKIIVLATDGIPNSCDCPDYGTMAPCDAAAQLAELDAVVAEADRVHNTLGITLNVIDVSTPDDPALRTHLTNVATAGGGDIYDGTDPAGLIDAFETIIADAQSCVITLDGMIVAGYEDDGTVTLGGEELEYEEDWQVNSPSEIELLGEACTKFKREAPTLSVKFPCNAIVVK